jgi:hypothetical protein
MNQLDGITVSQRSVVQTWPAYDLPIQLDDDGPRIEAEMAEQIGHAGGARNSAGLPVDHDLQLAHSSFTQGASRASVAAAGSGACHSARMAATP